MPHLHSQHSPKPLPHHPTPTPVCCLDRASSVLQKQSVKGPERGIVFCLSLGGRRQKEGKGGAARHHTLATDHPPLLCRGGGAVAVFARACSRNMCLSPSVCRAPCATHEKNVGVGAWVGRIARWCAGEGGEKREAQNANKGRVCGRTKQIEPASTRGSSRRAGARRQPGFEVREEERGGGGGGGTFRGWGGVGE